VHELRALVFGRFRLIMWCAAVDHDLMACPDEPQPNLFDAGFETAVAGRYPACSDKSDSHLPIPDFPDLLPALRVHASESFCARVGQ
jgi:hypothetical protein